MEDLINACAKGALAAVIIFPITLIINRWNKNKKYKEDEELEKIIKKHQEEK